MRRYGFAILTCGLLGAFSLTGCSPAITLSQETMALDGDQTVARDASGDRFPASYFYDIINNTTMMMPGGTFGALRSRFLIDSLMMDTLAGYEANDVDVRDYYYDYAQIKQAYEDLILETYWSKTLYQKTKADSLEAIQFYHDHPELFSADEQVDVYHILASPTTILLGPDSAQLKKIPRVELFEMAREYIYNLKQLLDWGEPFENVAYLYSHDATSRENGGHIGWTKRGQYIDPFDSVAFSLKPGTYSEPYGDKDGWHIIKVAAYLPAGPLPIDSPQVYESAMQTLLTVRSNKAMTERLDSLSKQIHFVANPAVLDTNIYLVDDTVWAAILNGTDTIDCRYLAQFEFGFRQKYDVDNTTPEQKNEMIKLALGRYIQLEAARQLGFDTLPEVAQRWAEAKHAKAKDIVKRRAYDPTWAPADSVVHAYYDSHIDEYMFDKPLQVEFMTIQDSAFAEFLHDQVESGLDMYAVAAEHSGEGGIRIDYQRPIDVGVKDLPEHLYTLALRTPTGTVSEVVASPEGAYQFVKVLKRYNSRYYDLAKGEIRIMLMKKHAEKTWDNFRDELYAKYGVVFSRHVALIELGNYHTRRPES